MNIPDYAERGGFRFDHVRLLRRTDMNRFGDHQLAATFGPYEVLQPIFASSCGASIVRVGPGHAADRQGFSTEHLLFVVLGSFTVHAGAETHRLVGHDLMFIPAFLDFQIANADPAEWSEYLSVNVRRDEWPGRRFLGDQVIRMELRSSPEG